MLKRPCPYTHNGYPTGDKLNYVDDCFSESKIRGYLMMALK